VFVLQEYPGHIFDWRRRGWRPDALSHLRFRLVAVVSHRTVADARSHDQQELGV